MNYEALEMKFRDLENHVKLMDEDEDNKVLQLMIENNVLEVELEDLRAKFRVLESEKRRAERDAEVWKDKFKRLESEVCVKDMNGTPHSSTPDIKDKEHDAYHRKPERARKHLTFGEEEEDTVLIRDNNVEGTETPPEEEEELSCNIVTEDDDDEEEEPSNIVTSEEEEEDVIPKKNVATPKRKRPSNMVTSDIEADDDEDDDVPIGDIKMMRYEELSCDTNYPTFDTVHGRNNSETPPRRRRLMTLRQLEEQQKETKDDDEDLEAEMESESESEGLSFIVHSSNISESGTDSATDTASNVFPDESDSEDLGEFLSTFGRNKTRKKEWEYEADMLADFGKDDLLCMKAVCALYRQQTSDEQMRMETVHHNKRGFSQFDALRGSALAKFITAGDLSCDVKISVEELRAHDPGDVELCAELARKYSKQLFQIYTNKEDPLFLPR